MLLRFVGVFSICVSSFFAACARAESPDRRKEDQVRPTRVSAALLKGYKVLASAVRNYPENRSCFSCHHQTLPLPAFSLRDSNLPRSLQFTNSVGTRGIVDFTTSSFEMKRPKLLEGAKIDGGALAVGYGLWTMEIARVKPNETTHAMVQYLLKTQSEDGGWELDSIRPPASSSRAMATAVAYLGLVKYGIHSPVDQEQVRSALKRAIKWSSKVKEPIDHEDLVGLLWLRYLVRSSEHMFSFGYGGMGMGGTHVNDSDLEDSDLEDSELPGTGRGGEGGMDMGGPGMGGPDLLDSLLQDSQRKDGGWGQANDLPSDAYATGMSLLIDAQTHSGYKIRSGIPPRARIDAIDCADKLTDADSLTLLSQSPATSKQLPWDESGKSSSTKTNSHSQITNLSRARTPYHSCSASSLPFSRVPFRLPKSRTETCVPVTRISACFRLIAVPSDSSINAQSGLRPRSVSPSTSGKSFSS